MTDPARAAIEAQILAWMREPEWRRDDERFQRLALTLFAFQFERCSPYRRFCEGRGRTPGTVHSWREIPAVPTGAFKELDLRCFPADQTLHRFRTSGTSTSLRGVLPLDTLEVYEASLLPSFRRFLVPDLAAEERMTIAALAPSPAQAPDSSLTHMFSVAIRELGTPGSDFYGVSDPRDVDRLLRNLEGAATRSTPLLLCSAAFTLVHLLDEMERRGAKLRLPDSARLMQTGGFKGRSREVSRDDLYARVHQRLGIPPTRTVDQYGMTELGSQFYDSALRFPDEGRRKLAPPWTRVAIIDPDTGKPAAPDEAGAIAIVDLANTGSVLALQTEDLGRTLGDGFEVIGREPGAEARGCSIAADALLSGPAA